MSYKIKLKAFEGPFDLLVYLIENAKMDIYDIQVSEITKQYLEYISQMQELNVEIASEFMVLAASLIQIKSKMLLPRLNENGQDIMEEDPRTDLAMKLLEYKKFKRMSEIFAELEEEASLVYEKPQEDISEFLNEPEEILKLDIEQFMRAFGNFLNKKKKVSEIKTRYENVEKKRITAEARVAFIRELFEINNQDTYTFAETVQNKNDKYDVALSFTSVMEMVKQRQLTAEQQAIFGEILVSKGETFDTYRKKENIQMTDSSRK